jgi:signal transduction histidine kinase
MMQKSAPDEKTRERAKTIVQQTQRVTDIIQTLLNVSRPHETKLVPLELGATVDHALDFYREKLRKHGVVVERHFGDVPEVQADRDRLEQVFLNLFVNAADAMPSGGALAVQISQPEPTHVEIRITEPERVLPPATLSEFSSPSSPLRSGVKEMGWGFS